MPSGITSTLYDGPETFEDFIMRCATLFVYDSSHPLPDSWEPDGHYSMRVADAEAAIDAIRGETDADSERILAEHLVRVAAENAATTETVSARRMRYHEMTMRVLEWGPPDACSAVRDAALQQLEESERFDCGEYLEPPFVGTAAEYREFRLAEAMRDLSYASKHLSDEMDRCRQRTAWVQALRASLSENVPT